jgi:pSer/pThr/pTyr-binding forkhead associated (FHA) protein
MRDGRTRKLAVRERRARFTRFLAEFRATLAVVEGRAAGLEHQIASPRVTLGRGPGVDFAVPDPAMSKQHACIEWAGSGLRVRDLGSTNGVRMDGSPIEIAELGHGDRFELGEHCFQLVLEKRERAPRTYVLPED